MGSVLLARKSAEHGFERLVAIKTIRRELSGDETLRQMFVDEARIMARLHHPNIAQVYDFGEDESELYLVLEYVAGAPFSALSELRPPPGIAAQAIAQVCRGLHAAHELRDRSNRFLGVVHRDVSPSNLMLSFDGLVKVLDFGIAWMRDRQSPETEFGTLKGKPPYMAPEQLRNEPVDRRTDIFAVCTVLHELLTGRRLFAANSPFAVARAIEHEVIPPPSRFTRLPRRLDELVLTGLERDPSRRFADALSLALELEQVAARLGAERLESYAQRELAPLQKQHDASICTALSAGQPTRSGGRPKDVHTVALPPGPRRTTAELPRAARASHRRRYWLVPGLLAAAGVLLVLGLRQPREREAGRPEATARAADLSAGRAIAQPPEVPNPSETARPLGATERPVEREGTRTRPVSKQVRTERSRSQRQVALRAGPRRHAPPVARPSAAVERALSDDRPAKLTIGAEPYALVRIDDRDLGTTPLLEHAITPGQHTIVLASPDSGRERLRRTIWLAPGAHEKIFVR